MKVTEWDQGAELAEWYQGAELAEWYQGAELAEWLSFLNETPREKWGEGGTPSFMVPKQKYPPLQPCDIYDPPTL